MVEPISLNAARAELNNDNRLVSPLECVEDLISSMRSGDVTCDKILVLRLTTADDSYSVGWNAAGMSASEMIALLEITKIDVLKAMNHVPDVD